MCLNPDSLCDVLPGKFQSRAPAVAAWKHCGADMGGGVFGRAIVACRT